MPLLKLKKTQKSPYELDVRVWEHVNCEESLEAVTDRLQDKVKFSGATRIFSEHYAKYIELVHCSFGSPVIRDAVLPLVKVQAEDLGFTKPASLSDIYWQANEIFLNGCPFGVGHHILRSLHIALPQSCVVSVSNQMRRGEFLACSIEKDGEGYEMDMDLGGNSKLYEPETEFVFVKEPTS